jgi:hypothetical protein
MFGLFGKSKSSGDSAEQSPNFYEVPVKVRRLEGSQMPSHMIGAVVACYVPANDHLAAAKVAVQRLLVEKLQFEDMAGQIKQLDPQQWDAYVNSVWPEFATQLPTQAELRQKLAAGQVFFGPFCAYEK